MRSLLGSEFRRFLLRPLVRVFAAVIGVASLAAAIVILFVSHPDSPEHIRLLEVRHEQAITRCVEFGFRPPLDAIDALDRREFCVAEGLAGPPLTFHLTQLLDIVQGEAFKGTAIPFVIVGFLLGASFAGAEWQAGAIVTLLGWETSRLRVFVAKVAVPLATVIIGVLAAQVLLCVSLIPAATLRGTTQGAGGAWLVELTGASLRVALLAGIAAGLGACLAMFGRSTAAALGAAVLYAVGELFIRGFEDPAWERWLIGENAGVFVTATPGPGTTPLGAFVVATSLLAATGLLAGRSFLRRDIV